MTLGIIDFCRSRLLDNSASPPLQTTEIGSHACLWRGVLRDDCVDNTAFWLMLWLACLAWLTCAQKKLSVLSDMCIEHMTALAGMLLVCWFIHPLSDPCWRIYVLLNSEAHTASSRDQVLRIKYYSTHQDHPARAGQDPVDIRQTHYLSRESRSFANFTHIVRNW